MSTSNSLNYYRFQCGVFIKAANFEEAKRIFIEKLQQEEENSDGWRACACLGISHRHDCPEMEGIIPY